MIYTWFLLYILIEIFIALRTNFELARTPWNFDLTLWMVGCVRRFRRKPRRIRMECNRHQLNIFLLLLRCQTLRFLLTLLQVRCQSHLQEFNWWDLLHCLASVSSLSLSTSYVYVISNFMMLSAVASIVFLFFCSWPFYHWMSSENNSKMNMLVNYKWGLV